MGEGAVDGNEEWGMGNEEWGSKENESELTERSRSEVFELTLKFPKYSLSDQIRRSSRSVSSNIAESWAKRLYPKASLNKLTEYITDIEYENGFRL